MLGREMRWRTPGWMSGLVIFDALGEVVGEASRAGAAGGWGGDAGRSPRKCHTYLHNFLKPTYQPHISFNADCLSLYFRGLTTLIAEDGEPITLGRELNA